MDLVYIHGPRQRNVVQVVEPRAIEASHHVHDVVEDD